jgi:hypothetical protein
MFLSMRLTRRSAEAIAVVAEREGITQKQVVFRALAASGIPVDERDLEDRSPRRGVKTR